MLRLVIGTILTVVILCFSSYAQEKTKITFLMIKGPTSTDTRETMYTTTFLAGKSTYDMVLMDIVWLPKFAKLRLANTFGL